MIESKKIIKHKKYRHHPYFPKQEQTYLQQNIIECKHHELYEKDFSNYKANELGEANELDDDELGDDEYKQGEEHGDVEGEEQHGGIEGEEHVDEDDEEENVINLFDYQKLHVRRLQEILYSNPFAIDTSVMGTGKTFCSSFIIKEMIRSGEIRHVVIVCPKSVKMKWNQFFDISSPSSLRENQIYIENTSSKVKKLPNSIIQILTYSELVSRRGCQPKHGLLYRYDVQRKKKAAKQQKISSDDEDEDEEDDVAEEEVEVEEDNKKTKKKVSERNLFLSSSMYNQMVLEGTFLIFDEVHNARNMNSFLLACQELVYPIISEYYCRSCSRNVSSSLVVVREEEEDGGQQKPQQQPPVLHPQFEYEEMVDISYNPVLPSMSIDSSSSSSSKDTDIDIGVVNSIGALVSGGSYRIRLPKSRSTSRMMMLTGSPGDVARQILNIFRILNILQTTRVSYYNPFTKSIVYRAIDELSAYFVSIYGDQGLVQHVLCNSASGRQSGKYSTKDITRFAAHLYLSLLKPLFNSFMVQRPSLVEIDDANGFYWLLGGKKEKLSTVTAVERERLLNLYQSIDMLKSGSAYDEKNGTVDMKKQGASLGIVNHALQCIEKAKVPLFVRLVREQFSRSNNTKVCVCVNYTETLNLLETQLARFSPLRLDGSCSDTQRVNVVNEFQSTEPSSSRLLLCNIRVSNSGLDIDDKHGDFPRVVYVSPNYSTITLYQLIYRFRREDSKSSPRIHFVFCREDHEDKIIDSLAKKSDTMKLLVSEQVETRMKFPGDFKPYYEEEEKVVPNEDDNYIKSLKEYILQL